MTVVLWAGEDYAYGKLVKSVFGSSLQAYYILNEGGGAGGGVAVDSSGNGRHGTYGTGLIRGATLSNQLQICPSVASGANDEVDIASLGQLSWWNGNEFTIHLWLKTSAWGTVSYMRGIQIGTDANNYVMLSAQALTNNMYLELKCGGVSRISSIATSGTTGWFSVSATHSVTNNRVRAYLNGAQVYTNTSPGSWVGSIPSNGGYIFASAPGSGGSNWSGNGSDVCLGNAELTTMP